MKRKHTYTSISYRKTEN